jgi:hypothetical protein
MDGRFEDGQTWFTQHSGAALFLAGCAMVFVGLFRGGGTTAVTSAFLGCGLMLVGALLPRLTGTIKVTPSSIELGLAERLEATRREVEARAPELEEAALTRALEEMLPRLAAAATAATAPTTATAPSARTGRAAGWWRTAAVGTAAVAVFGLAAVGGLAVVTQGLPLGDDAQLALTGDGEGDAVTGGGAPPPPPADEGAPDPVMEAERGTAVVWLAAVLALTIAGVAVWAGRARSEPPAAAALTEEPAPTFARRIVDELVTEEPPTARS